MKKGNLASIDLGSNSCRLRIVDDKSVLLYNDSKATNLAEGLFETGSLTENAQLRALNALSEFAVLIDLYEVSSYRAVATAACREAQNGADFVRQVYEKTGLKLEIIDTYEEARLNLKGALLNAPKNKKYAVVYDLGGASTEISLAENNAEARILHTISIPWGSRNASVAYNLQEFDTAKVTALKKEVKAYVESFMNECGFKKYQKDCCLIATSMTPLRLCSMIKKDEVYAREKNDGAVVTCTDFDEAIKNVYGMNMLQKAQSPYIGENRAPIFTAACVIFKAVYDELKFDRLIVSYKSAQDAILKELQYGENDKVRKVCSRTKNIDGSR